jgi:hypothetical protein
LKAKKYGLKFNQMALMLLAEYTDPKHETATAGYALFYAGLKSNAYAKREEFEMSFEDSCDLFDKLTPEQITEISAAFNESIAFQKELPKEEKKRTVKKTTS